MGLGLGWAGLFLGLLEAFLMSGVGTSISIWLPCVVRVTSTASRDSKYVNQLALIFWFFLVPALNLLDSANPPRAAQVVAK